MSTKAEKPKDKIATKQPCEFPAIEFVQGTSKLYLLACSAKALWKLVKINRKIEDKDEGYQRTLSDTRVTKIARFIEGGNVIPLSILVSLDKDSEFDKKTRVLRIPNKPDAGWVIDGQHRLAGARSAGNDIALPVVAIVGAETPEQIKLFVTINREQKGVPSSLYYELLKSLPQTESEKQISEKRAVEIANALKADDRSPFFGKIVATTSPTLGQLSLTNFVRKVAPLVRSPNGTLMSLKPDGRPQAITNYYKALAQVFPKQFGVDSIFFKTVGFGAAMNVFPMFFVTTLGQQGGNFQVGDAAAVLKKIDDFDFNEWKEMGTGSKAELEAAEALREALQDATATIGDGSAIKL